jgi:hypothetical protein
VFYVSWTIFPGGVSGFLPRTLPLGYRVPALLISLSGTPLQLGETTLHRLGQPMDPFKGGAPRSWVPLLERFSRPWPLPVLRKGANPGGPFSNHSRGPDGVTFFTSRYLDPDSTATARYKTILGQRMRSRSLDRQRVEVRLASRILNTMTSLGMPDSVKVEGKRPGEGGNPRSPQSHAPTPPPITGAGRHRGPGPSRSGSLRTTVGQVSPD